MFILELVSIIGMIYVANKVNKIDKNTELYVRFEANPSPNSFNKPNHNSDKSQASNDSWVRTSVNS